MAIGSEDGQLHIYFNNGFMFTSYQNYSFGEYTVLPADITPDGKWIAVAGYTKNPDLEGRVTVFHYETIDNSYK